jgi:hypothetical protein
MKANIYKVGNHSSKVGNDCTSSSSNESASVDASDPSIPMPNSFKPSPRSSFEVSNILLSKGHAMATGPVANLHLGSPGLLQPAKGANEGYGNGSGRFAKHKKALR